MCRQSRSKQRKIPLCDRLPVGVSKPVEAKLGLAPNITVLADSYVNKEMENYRHISGVAGYASIITYKEIDH